MEKILSDTDRISAWARRFKDYKDLPLSCPRPALPIALEGALKLKEISYIHAEGYAAGEMKHGPIALIDVEMPVMVLLRQGHLYEKMISNIQEVKARDGIILALIESETSEMVGPAENQFVISILPPSGFRRCSSASPCNCWPIMWRCFAEPTLISQETWLKA